MTHPSSLRAGTPRGAWISILPLCLAVLALAAAAAPAAAQPFFSKSFSANTIGPGSVSRLTFFISNVEAEEPVSDMAFTDVLPAGVTLADPAFAATDCLDALLAAPDGGTTITFTEGRLGLDEECTVAVDVTSSTPGTHTNVSGDLTSSAGNSGPATADLTVVTNRPGFLKSFTPSMTVVGGTSTLTLTIDNTANGANVDLMNFTDSLPTGMTIATPSGASTTCTGGILPANLTATAGTSVISLTFGFVAAGATCEVEVEVVTEDAGVYVNRTGTLNANGNAGIATAGLTVMREFLTKTFTDDPAPPGGTVTLEFAVVNFDRFDPATDITFTDDLDATLTGLAALGLPLANPCGPGSQLTGASFLTLSGGNLGPEESCTFSVTLQVPAGATPGTYPNTTSQPSADVGGVPTTYEPATDDLVVAPVPILTKEFTDDPVAAGGDVTLEFTLTNTSATDDATGITFTDNLAQMFAGITATLPPAGFCGPGSSIALVPPPTPPDPPQTLSLTGAELGPSGSCTFSVTLHIPTSASSGAYLNTTSTVSATVDGSPVTGSPASDTLVVVGPPLLGKTFTDDPVVAGSTVTLQFDLALDESATAGATNVTFSDDLGATLAGLAAVGLPMTDVCGVGSQITGTTNLSFTGGSLAPGETCSFSVTLQVPAGAAPGSYPNTTSNVSAMVLGLNVVGQPAVDNLDVAGLSLAKAFTDDPVVPGATVNLQFTLDNLSPVADATGIGFTDNLNAALTGLVATGLPMMDVCGAGSQISGTSTLTFTGGNLPAGASCTFNVTLQVPAGAAPGEYFNVTSTVTATVGGSPTVLPAANDTLFVIDALMIGKEFTDDPAVAGGTVTLELTITNASPSQSATGVTFTDDLDATLSGLVAVGLPQNDVCGAGSQIAGTSLLTLTGGNLPPSSSCTFAVTLQVPAGVPSGTTALNTTSAVTGDVGGVGVTGDPATDELRIAVFDFTKAFDGPSTAGGAPVLTFTITNNDDDTPAAELSFTDDLDAVIPGLVATGLPQNDVCGEGSVISGTSFLTLSSGSLPPGGTCVINVALQVPAGVAPGDYPNTTSELFLAGVPSSNPATATLTIEPPPTFSKGFAPDSIGVDGLSTLTFVVDNTASAVAASDLDFTDNLPAGVVVAAAPNASTTCTGGTITAAAGTGVVAYTGGTVAAGGSCSVQADVTAAGPGVFVNTSGDLTSSSGTSGTATDTLTVNPQPGFAKAFAPDPIAVGGVSTLTFTVDNTASTVAATNLDFTDAFPAGMTVATPANASTTCTGGTLTATSGAGMVSYTGGSVAAGATCTVQVDVTSSASGTLTNTSGNLTSSLGVSGTATDTLTVDPPPGFAKVFSPNPITVGGVTTLTFTIDNGGSTVAATNLDFTDNLPSALAVATPPNASTTCTGGTLTAVAGSGVVSYTGGSVAAGATCTVQADVTSDSSGINVNVTGELTSSLGSSGAATDTLAVDLALPGFSKGFMPGLIQPGGVSTLVLTIDNTGNTEPVGNVAFTDSLPAGVVVATPANASTDCAGGTVTAAPGSGVVSYSGGTAPAMASCSVAVDVTSSAVGTHVNTAGPLTSDAGTSGTATAELTVIEAVAFSKQFLQAVLPGGQVELEYTITNPRAAFGLDAVSFTDDFDAVIPGLVAEGLPQSDVCGAGSQVTGTSTLTLTGGNVPPAGSCTFVVTLRVPADAEVGTYPSTTSPLSGEVDGVPVTAPPATAELEIVFLSFSKAFIGPAVVSGTTTLEFTLTNPDPLNTASGITFTDDLEAVVPGLTAIGLPQMDVCGAGSELSGTSLLTLSDGLLGSGETCTFAVVLQIPADAPEGDFTNVTSVLRAAVGGSTVEGDPAGVATAVLTISGTPLDIPTLNGWALLLLAGALTLLAWRRLRSA